MQTAASRRSSQLASPQIHRHTANSVVDERRRKMLWNTDPDAHRSVRCVVAVWPAFYSSLADMVCCAQKPRSVRHSGNRSDNDAAWRCCLHWIMCTDVVHLCSPCLFHLPSTITAFYGPIALATALVYVQPRESLCRPCDCDRC